MFTFPPPLRPVQDYLERCDAARRERSADEQAAIAERSEAFRLDLVEVHELDVTDPNTVAAIAAGSLQNAAAALVLADGDPVVEGVVNHATLAVAWYLYDLAVGTDACTSGRCFDALGCPNFIPAHVGAARS